MRKGLILDLCWRFVIIIVSIRRYNHVLFKFFVSYLASESKIALILTTVTIL